MLICGVLTGCGTPVALPGSGDSSAGSHDLGRLSSGQSITVLLTLANPVAGRLDRVVSSLQDPRSPLFGRSLTPGELQAYGPPAKLVNAVRRYLGSRGIRTDWKAGNDWLLASAGPRPLEALFGVRIHRYVSSSGVPYYAADRSPRIPASLRTMVAGVGSIDSFPRRLPLRRPRAATILPPSSLLSIYDLQPLRKAGFDGSGITVAFIETDGYKQSDLDAFSRKFGVPSFQPQVRYGKSLSYVAGETEMDMEIVHAIAPKATMVIYNCPGQCGNNDMLKAEDAAVRGTPHGIISISLGGCEPDEGAATLRSEASNFTRADALAESVFVSSGDSGAFTCLMRNWGASPSSRYIGVSSPASMPGVTGVGGTRLQINANGTRRGEVVWEVPPQTAGTGGGVSSFFSRPSWQTGRGVTSTRRGVPDVAALADPVTSPGIVISGTLQQGGGTSEAAPIWAGMMALINQYLQRSKIHVAGFVNPTLYALARGKPTYPPFHDVTVGSNLVNNAGVGYDLATGLGTPDGWNLARDLAAYFRGETR